MAHWGNATQSIPDWDTFTKNAVEAPTPFEDLMRAEARDDWGLEHQKVEQKRQRTLAWLRNNASEYVDDTFALAQPTPDPQEFLPLPPPKSTPQVNYKAFDSPKKSKQKTTTTQRYLNIAHVALAWGSLAQEHENAETSEPNDIPATVPRNTHTTKPKSLPQPQSQAIAYTVAYAVAYGNKPEGVTAIRNLDDEQEFPALATPQPAPMVSCKKLKKIEKNMTTTQGLPNKKVDKGKQVSFEAPSAPLSTNSAREPDTRKPSHPNGIPALTTAISKNGDTNGIHPTSQRQIQTTVWGNECKGVTSAQKLFPAVPPPKSTQPAPNKIPSQRRKRTVNIPKAPTRERLATIQKSQAPEQNTTNTANTNSHQPSIATSLDRKANANSTTPTSQSQVETTALDGTIKTGFHATFATTNPCGALADNSAKITEQKHLLKEVLNTPHGDWKECRCDHCYNENKVEYLKHVGECEDCREEFFNHEMFDGKLVGFWEMLEKKLANGEEICKLCRCMTDLTEHALYRCLRPEGAELDSPTPFPKFDNEVAERMLHNPGGFVNTMPVGPTVPGTNGYLRSRRDLPSWTFQIANEVRNRSNGKWYGSV